jgi:starch phosphorylase
VGWAIGDGKDRGDDPSWDATEADALYALLEEEIGAAFYVRDDHGIPRGWVGRMRESMARLTPAFSANRTVREYTETHYLPAAAAYRERAANGGRQSGELLTWRKQLERYWGAARFMAVDVQTNGEQYTFHVHVDLGGLDPEGVRLELYAEGLNGGTPVRQPMTRMARVADSTNLFLYAGDVQASRSSSDFTPRLIPFHAGASVPLEAPFILWYARPQ